MKTPCPRCGDETRLDYPSSRALSRTDNKTHICTICGVREAGEAYVKHTVTPQTEWWLATGKAVPV